MRPPVCKHPSGLRSASWKFKDEGKRSKSDVRGPATIWEDAALCLVAFLVKGKSALVFVVGLFGDNFTRQAS